jgi:NTP pyrophosphatase (non-canonical NTP hydrolase)
MQDEIAAVVQTFQQFSAANRERCESPRGFNHALQSWSTSDWFTATMGELGEAANVAKKLNRVRDGIPGNKESEAALRDKLRRELADTFVYLDLLCQALGFNIGDAAIEVFNAKSAEIGYPLLLADRLSAASSSPGETREQEQEDHARVDGECCKRGTGSTASHNEVIPATDGPPWWCATCESWRFVQPCGRDECPRPLDEVPR